MASATESIEINRPVEEVYRFLADGLNNPKWRPAVINITLVSGAGGAAGAVYRQTLKGPFGRIHGDYRLVEASPNSRIKFEVVSGPARPVGLFVIEPARDGTRVRFSLNFEPKGLMRLMNGMIQRTMEGEVKNLANLKAALESSGRRA